MKEEKGSVFISQFRSQNEKEAPENTSRKKIGSPQ
jgi:hypothetical protein